jgi:uncharacterized protein YegP (UPF0339 family)
VLDRGGSPPSIDVADALLRTGRFYPVRSANLSHFHLKAPNGEIIVASQAYASKANAQKGIQAIKKHAPDATRISSRSCPIRSSSFNARYRFRRDDFPNNFVGDLVKTDRGWVVVPPTYCPAGHDYGDGVGQ